MLEFSALFAIGEVLEAELPTPTRRAKHCFLRVATHSGLELKDVLPGALPSGTRTQSGRTFGASERASWRIGNRTRKNPARLRKARHGLKMAPAGWVESVCEKVSDTRRTGDSRSSTRIAQKESVEELTGTSGTFASDGTTSEDVQEAQRIRVLRTLTGQKLAPLRKSGKQLFMDEIDQLTMAKVHQILAETGATGGSEALSTREALGGQTLRGTDRDLLTRAGRVPAVRLLEEI